MQYLCFRLCLSGEESSGSSAVRRRKGMRTFYRLTKGLRWFKCALLCVFFRVIVVKQTRDILPPLNNATLVDVVVKSILPPSSHLLSAQEVTDAIEKNLQTKEDIWTSWTVRHINVNQNTVERRNTFNFSYREKHCYSKFVKHTEFIYVLVYSYSFCMNSFHLFLNCPKKKLKKAYHHFLEPKEAI